MFYKKRLIFVYLLLCSMLLLSTTAYAYIDPAATSYIVQIVAGLFITVGVGLSIFWKRIRVFFRKAKLKALEKKLSRQAEKTQPKN